MSRPLPPTEVRRVAGVSRGAVRRPARSRPCLRSLRSLRFCLSAVGALGGSTVTSLGRKAALRGYALAAAALPVDVQMPRSHSRFAECSTAGLRGAPAFLSRGARRQ